MDPQDHGILPPRWWIATGAIAAIFDAWVVVLAFVCVI